MPGEGGPLGGIAGANGSSPSVIEMTGDHGLADRDRIRISTAGGDVECYAKVSGFSTKLFASYGDAELKKPQTLQAGPGDTVDRLNADDWALVVGINYYPGFTNLEGPVYDADHLR